jgi:hypothetical protein
VGIHTQSDSCGICRDASHVFPPLGRRANFALCVHRSRGDADTTAMSLLYGKAQASIKLYPSRFGGGESPVRPTNHLHGTFPACVNLSQSGRRSPLPEYSPCELAQAVASDSDALREVGSQLPGDGGHSFADDVAALMSRQTHPNCNLLWDRKGSFWDLCSLLFLANVGSKYSNRRCDKGKPVVRRGRKATGLFRGGGRVVEQRRGLDNAPSHKTRRGAEVVSYRQYL